MSAQRTEKPAACGGSITRNPQFNPISKEHQAIIDRVGKSIAKAKSHWARDVMRRALPREMFDMAYAKRDHAALRDYLVANNIREVQSPDSVSLMRGEEVLGVFKVEFKDGKVNIMAKVMPLPPEPPIATGHNPA